MKRSRLAISSLWPLGLALAVLLAAGGAWGQTPWTKYEDNPVLEAGRAGRVGPGRCRVRRRPLRRNDLPPVVRGRPHAVA